MRMWGLCGLPECRDAGLRDEEGAACIDRLHEVVGLHGQRFRTAQIDRRGVVHAQVDTTELGDGPFDGAEHLILEPDIADDGKGLPARQPRSLRPP